VKETIRKRRIADTSIISISIKRLMSGLEVIYSSRVVYYYIVSSRRWKILIKIIRVKAKDL